MLLLHYNWVYFGQVFLSGYDYDDFRLSVPLWLGLTGLLVAPSRGVLVYSPALLIALWGLRRWMRGDPASHAGTRRLVLSWTAAAGVTLLFFARWHGWAGGWSYGPRELCETMPILCLLFATAYDGLRRPWQRRVAAGLVTLSIGVHAVGVFGYSGYEAWQRRHDLPDQGRSLFALRDTQIEAHARALVNKLFR